MLSLKQGVAKEALVEKGLAYVGVTWWAPLNVLSESGLG